MMGTKRLTVLALASVFLLTATCLAAEPGARNDLSTPGVLHHLGIPYAHFVTGSGDGFDVELMQDFAASLGVEYRFVQSSWSRVIGDLTGVSVQQKSDGRVVTGKGDVRGDAIASGFTVLPWRSRVVRFSDPVFPTQVWLVTRIKAPIRPIEPSGDIAKDIELVKSKLQDLSVLGMANTCLDPRQYQLQDYARSYLLFYGNVNDLAPALLAGEADSALLDAPDVLVAMHNWPGKLKIVGPVTGKQNMAVAFRPDDRDLCEAFNQFLRRMKRSGRYLELVNKYYPGIKRYFPDFFEPEN